MCSFDVSWNESAAQPAIVVIVEPLTSANWSELRARIISLISPHMENDGVVEVEFKPGRAKVSVERGGCR